VNHLLITGLVSLGISIVLTPIFRDIFRSFKVVDQPDRNRKVHVYPIPRVGGIAIAIAYFVVFYIMRRDDGAALDRELAIVFKILPAGLVVFATGLIDDFFGLKPWQKFLGQFAAAGLACWAGVKISGISGYILSDLWAIPLTLGWLVVCTDLRRVSVCSRR
jgi:UDP-GlcNAc:undecaprenyl-phosphate/decaprenyl-phosphate GlcNAc-1-phosphate transferase